MSSYHSIIRYPLITEKNTAQRSRYNKYVFEVAPDATKQQIKDAVQKIFNVNVIGVNTLVLKGKRKRMGRFSGYRANRKKAIVRIAANQTIEKFGEV